MVTVTYFISMSRFLIGDCPSFLQFSHPDLLLPAEGMELFFGADELDGAVVE